MSCSVQAEQVRNVMGAIMIKFKFRKVDDGYYDVFWRTVKIGCVYKDMDAWSYARWFIEGGRHRIENGGVGGLTRKPYGYSTRYRAAQALAISQSGRLIK